MSDYIKREDAIRVIAEQMMYDADVEYNSGTTDQDLADWKEYAKMLLADLPSADVIPRDYYEKVVEELCHKHTEEIESLMAERSEDEDRIRESQRIPKGI